MYVGGPLLGIENGEQKVIGILSFEFEGKITLISKCWYIFSRKTFFFSDDRPTVFTNLVPYFNWIREESGVDIPV